jgi:hypothetical protein
MRHLPERVGYVLMNWGANDMEHALVEATWIAQYGSIVELVHDRFPNAKLFITYPWRLNFDAEAATLHEWIDDVIAAHSSYTFPGVDEAITIKRDDNGATTTDYPPNGSGVHYNALGADLYAQAMRDAILAAGWP